MSRSEGLVYKPYSGPCPPATGFMTHLYGNCGQLGLPVAAGDLLNTANGVPASHQQQNMGVLPGSPAMGPKYFSSPYGMVMANPINSTSAVEQVSPLCSARPNGGKTLHSRGSRNLSFTRSDAFSGCPLKHNNTSKDSELQASTASSPCYRPQGEGKEVLPLFPMAPAGEGSCQPSLSNGREQQSHVIKVVPHNGRSATESAARIFRSIQQERQQLDI
ncbi:hypothetical protein HPP92_005219 [Vanilla planifolia]|uniref:Early flowering 3 n=1 Tax=Vanilla planifolia TaxID=51239 RepID=A0A835RN34_VANPL|nr:hypothetical protein HPP92_005219 [Vanilla planifolia]